MAPLELLSNNYDDFTKAEQRVAKYIINTPQCVIHENLTMIAKNASSSNAAVIRMCQKIGFSGFSDFRYALTRQLMAGEAEIVTEEKSTLHPYEKIINDYTDYIKKIPITAPEEQIAKLADKICRAGRIDILGMNRTALSAQLLAHRLERMGIYNKFTDDPILMLDDASILKDGDLAILFTLNGRGTTEYSSILREFKDHHCDTVLITMNPKLKFAQSADMLIQLPFISHEIDRNFYEDQIIVFMFIEFLLYEIAKRKNLSD